jgi:hypothetical protein
MCETWGEFEASVKGGACIQSLIPEAAPLLGGSVEPISAEPDETEEFEMVWAQDQVSTSPAHAPPFLFSPAVVYPSDLFSLQFIPLSFGSKKQMGISSSIKNHTHSLRSQEELTTLSRDAVALIQKGNAPQLQAMLSSTVPLVGCEWRSCFELEIMSALSNKELVLFVESCNRTSAYAGSQLCTYLLLEQLSRLVMRTKRVSQEWAWLQRLIPSVVQASQAMQLPPLAFRKRLSSIGLRDGAGPLGPRAEIAVASAYYQGLGMPAC